MVRTLVGVADIEEENKQHKTVFYKLFDKEWQKKQGNSTIVDKERYKRIVDVCERSRVMSPAAFKELKKQDGYKQASKWVNNMTS